MRKYTLISLFSGISGSSLGFHNTGRIIEVLAVDNDSYVKKCFNLNFPDVPFYSKPIIRNLSGDELLQFASQEFYNINKARLDLKKGDLDILFASPPCQGFSTARGLRNINDSRNDLFFQTIRLINELQPLTFIIENVPGLISGKMKVKFNQIIEEIDHLSYQYRYKILNAANYNVPQLRERIFFIGVRDDLGISPVFPATIQNDLEKLALYNYVDNVDFFASGQFLDHGFDRIYPADQICRTITAGASMKFWKDGIQRKPTITEIKKLCSFPADYKLSPGDEINPLTGQEYSYNKKYKGLGNSVPPKLMKAVAMTVIEEILDIHYRGLDNADNQYNVDFSNQNDEKNKLSVNN